MGIALRKKPFDREPRQTEASRLMAQYMFFLAFGGRRSGKTFIIMCNIFARALYKHSRHIAVRKTFAAIKNSVWHETIPKVLRICYPMLKEGVNYRLNRSDFYIEFLKNGSTVWIGGLDDKERMEKILGREYSTGYINEASSVNYDGYEMVLSGLAENSGLPLKMWGDCNPPSKKHWTYQLFVKGLNPETKKPLRNQKKNYAHLLMNPEHNRRNLPTSYFDILDNLSSRKRKRFRDGLFGDDTEGALWDHDMINAAQLEEDEEWISNPLQTVVAVDPNVAEDAKAGEEFEADEAGIVVVSKDVKGNDAKGKGLIEADYSGEYSANQWIKKSIWAYHYHNADCIVAEKNQGGALVKISIRAAEGGEAIPIKLVWASKGKHARAEPVTVLYEKGQIKHAPGLDKLEDELLEYVPSKTKKSPGRLDAAVWGATHLFLGNQRQEDSMYGVLF